MRVLIAGLAGASLGTEIIKSLSAASQYEVFGCDISPLAYGLFSDRLKESFVVDKENYIDSIIEACNNRGINFVIPGGEQPMVLLGKNDKKLKLAGIQLVGNTPEIIELFSDKHRTFQFLREIGVLIPATTTVEGPQDLKNQKFPCIVKPSSGTGGSDSVFLATSEEECLLYVELLKRNNRMAIVQEYIDVNEGEFTIGVLSDTEGMVIGSVAMQRMFNSKLSISYRGEKGLISSGYSQGLIADFSSVRQQAELIAVKAESKGPLNIQGRLRNGVLIPFEINPRFSASTYLRTMAGFNEVHLFLQYLNGARHNGGFALKEGYYLRSFEEQFVPKS